MRGSCRGKLQCVPLPSSDVRFPSDPTILDKTRSLPADHYVGTYASVRRQLQDSHLNKHFNHIISQNPIKENYLLFIFFFWGGGGGGEKSKINQNQIAKSYHIYMDFLRDFLYLSLHGLPILLI